MADSKTPFPRVFAFVLAGSVGLLTAWVWFNKDRLLATPDDHLRAFCVLVFLGLTLVRRADYPGPAMLAPKGLKRAAVIGTFCTILGLVVPMHIVEWIGLLLLLLACLTWALPVRMHANLAAGLLILVWLHPLPTQLIGPLQLAMQKLSVLGAELVLHLVNVPVAADGMVLYNGYRAFEVPEACSGMRTAVTTLVCCFGFAALYRITLLQTLGLCVAGLIQVLALNILRICLFVKWAGNHPEDWTVERLHTTAGVLLLAAVVLLQVEIVLLRWWRRHGGWYLKEQRRREKRAWFTEDVIAVIVTVPRLLAIAALAALIILPVAILRAGPTHRAAMLSVVVDALAPTDPLLAERIAARQRRLVTPTPASDLRQAQILLRLNQPDAALRLLTAIPSVARDAQYVVTRCWALVQLKRAPEAAELIRAISPNLRHQPAVAVIAAEMAAARGDVAELESLLPHVTSAPTLAERASHFYPFLAAHQRWNAIAAADRTHPPYRDPTALQLALTAHLVRSDYDAADRTLHANTALWLGQPTFTRVLLEMARVRPDAWANRATEHLLLAIPTGDTDRLLAIHTAVLTLPTPAAAAALRARLAALDATHPLLPILDAQLTTWPPATLATALWKQAAEALVQRDAQGGLSESGLFACAHALEMGGQPAAAAEKLELICARSNAAAPPALMRLMQLYATQNDWMRTYEACRRYASSGFPLSPEVARTTVVALSMAGQGFMALEAARQGFDQFAARGDTLDSVCLAWEVAGHPEEALFTLQSRRAGAPDQIQRLRAAGRRGEGERYRPTSNRPETTPTTTFAPLLARAENVLAWQPRKPAAPVSDTRVLSMLPPPSEAAKSAFFADLHQATRALLDATNAAPDPARWEAIGRNAPEQAAALQWLAALLVLRGDGETAASAVASALQHAPDSPLLWRLRVALSEGDETVIATAREHCPRDPELWLAEFVRQVQRGQLNDAEHALTQALDAQAYNPETFLRAADCLLRHGRAGAAYQAADRIAKADPGIVAAYALALDAALTIPNYPAALAAAKMAATLADDPAPFARHIVMIVMGHPPSDATGLEKHLRALSARFPDEKQWQCRLAAHLFESRRLDDAWMVFGTLFRQPPSNIPPGLFLYAAEAASQAGATAESERILREARQLYPRSVSVLNNLIYTLAQRPPTRAEAVALVPELLTMTNAPAYLETAGLAALQAGQLDRAQALANQALASLNPSETQLWNVVHITAARIQVACGRPREALALLERTTGGAATAALRDRSVAELLRTIQSAPTAGSP